MASSSDQKTANALGERLFSLVGPNPENKKTFLSIVKGGIPVSKASLAWLTNPKLAASPEDLRQAREMGAIFNSIPPTVGSWNRSAVSMDTTFRSWLSQALYPKYELPPQHRDALLKAGTIIKENYADYRTYKARYDSAWIAREQAFKADPSDPALDDLDVKLKDAEMDWEVLGNRKAVEAAYAEKAKLESVGMASAFTSLSDNFDAIKKRYNCALTTLAPSDFFDNPELWTRVSFSAAEATEHSEESSRSWGGGVGVSYGLWSIGGSASGSESSRTLNANDEKLTVEFEFCRTPIIREWFDAGLLFSRDWWWNGATQAQPSGGAGPIFSDGAQEGVWPLIPTEVIWTRNLKVTFSSQSSSLKEVQKAVSGGGSVGFGFFSVSANYSQSSGSRDQSVRIDGNTLTVDGTSIAAFLCQVMPKEPDPKPTYIDQFGVVATVAPPAVATTRRHVELARLDATHDVLNGIFDSLKKKAGDLLANGGKILVDRAKEKAAKLIEEKGSELKDKITDAATNWAKQKLDKLKGQSAIYATALKNKDAWRSYASITQNACFDVPLQPHQLIEGAQIAARVNAPNLDSARRANAKDSMSIALVTSKVWPAGKTIRVRFLDGDKNIQKNVIKAAKLWEAYANVKFDFGTDPQAEIRISFLGTGSWSLIGTDCLLSDYDGKPTMNFGWFNSSTSETEYRRTVVHEFGHALGAIHEHQNPNGNISWNEALARQYYKASQGWTDEMVTVNLFQKYSIDILRASQYDPKSIMHYPIPVELVTDPNDAVGLNDDLSATDKQWIAEVYPKGKSGLADVDPKANSERAALADVLAVSRTPLAPGAGPAATKRTPPPGDGFADIEADGRADIEPIRDVDDGLNVVIV